MTLGTEPTRRLLDLLRIEVARSAKGKRPGSSPPTSIQRTSAVGSLAPPTPHQNRTTACWHEIAVPRTITDARRSARVRRAPTGRRGLPLKDPLMPMLDAPIPEGALDPVAERRLVIALTDILLAHEGADPTDADARSLARVFLHRPAALFVSGEELGLPRYRIVASVPEGQLDNERGATMVAAVTEAERDAVFT